MPAQAGIFVSVFTFRRSRHIADGVRRLRNVGESLVPKKCPYKRAFFFSAFKQYQNIFFTANITARGSP